MKKKITMTLIAVMVLSVLAACGNAQDTGSDFAGIAAAPSETGEVKVENIETKEEVPEETIQEASTEEVKEVPGEDSTIPPMDPRFDAGYYARVYPDISEIFGNNEALLWKHYVEFGEREGRKCYDGDPGGSIVVNGQMAQSANETAAPANDTVTPANDTAAPANDTAAPANDTAAPANDTATPANDVTAPADDINDTAASSNDTAAPADNITADQYAQIMLEQINTYRAENGVAPLEFRQDCLDTANLRVWELTELFSHTRPNGKRFNTAFDDCGYHISNCAENISVHHSDWDFESEGDINVYVEHFMNNFKNSASHNATMLNSKWKYVGFAFVTNYDGNCYVAQEFAK